LGIDGRVKLIGFIGRVNHQKNVIVAIKTCMEVLLRRNDARVLWIGEGPFLDQVRDIAKSSGLFNYFYFFNFRKDIPDILQAIDVLFMPSNFEGFPLLVLEALHAGVPFVGSNTPGILEALPDRLQRFCAEPDNINAHVENVFEAFQSTRGSINGDDFLGQFSPVAFHKRVAMKYTASLSK
jgi:glycosyltransferase involved in cell wall biosynthesis